MSNLYVKTVTELFDEWIATLTPYEKCLITQENKQYTQEKGHYILQVQPETHVGPEKWKGVDEIPIGKLQLCIELDGQLYIWHEWKGL